MTPLVDCHSHTALSGHGTGTVAEAVARAKELGLAVYCQTEHMWMPERLDPTHTCSMSRAQVAQYRDACLEQRARLTEKKSPLIFVMGTEIDWFAGRGPELEELCAGFEYVLGSVHHVDEWAYDDPDELGHWDEHGTDWIWRRYFELWLEMAGSTAPITAFSHPDLPKKFGFRPSFDARPYYSEMAAAAARRGAMVEVNAAGLHVAAGELYPCQDLLRAFCDAGVECTVGCDAHNPADIARDVRAAYEWMARAGYAQVSAPTPDGDRIRWKLEV